MPGWPAQRAGLQQAQSCKIACLIRGLEQLQHFFDEDEKSTAPNAQRIRFSGIGHQLADNLPATNCRGPDCQELFPVGQILPRLIQGPFRGGKNPTQLLKSWATPLASWLRFRAFWLASASS